MKDNIVLHFLKVCSLLVLLLLTALSYHPMFSSFVTDWQDINPLKKYIYLMMKVIGIRHGEKMYETLLTKEECAKAVDMGNFYRVPADNRDLNYDKFFTEGDVKHVTIEEFNSDNAYRLSLEETKAKVASLEYIQEELAKKK